MLLKLKVNCTVVESHQCKAFDITVLWQAVGPFLVLTKLKVVQLSAFKVPKICNSYGGKVGDFPR